MEVEGKDNHEPKLTNKGIQDYNLVRAALDNDDQKAFAELLQRYQESIYSMIFKIIGNETDAEDLTIEAFGKAFNQLHKYSPSYSFSTWLFRIATNHTIDFIKKNKLKNAAEVDVHNNEEENGLEHLEQLHFTNNNPEQDMEEKQRVIWMREIVEKLHPQYKLLIEAYYYEEMSFDQISKKYNIPLGTIKGQMSRARELLAFLLKKQ